MCKYCELKNGESICLTDRKHDDFDWCKKEEKDDKCERPCKY